MKRTANALASVLEPASPLREAQRYGKFGEPENNWFKTPDIYSDACARGVFSGPAEEHLVELVMREEWGGFGGPKRKGAPIRTPDIAVRLHISEKQAANATARLIEAGFCELVGKRGGVNCYHVNLAKIADAAPYVYVPPKLAIVPEPEPAASVTRWVIPPGKKGRFTYPVPIPGTDEWTEDTMDVNNGASTPLALAATRKGRRVQLDIEDATAEEKAKQSRNAFPGPGDATAEEKANVNRNAFPGSPSQVIDSKRNSNLRSAITEILAREWDESLTDAFLARIVKAAGSFLPADEFAVFANRDLQYKKNRIGEGRNSRTKHKPEILIAYATQASRRWAEKADERQVAERATRQRETGLKQEFAFDTTGDETAWPLIRKALRPQISEESFVNWFVRTRGEGVNAKGTLLVTVPDAQTAAFMAEEFREIINRTAAVVDASIERVQFRAPAKTEVSHG